VHIEVRIFVHSEEVDMCQMHDFEYTVTVDTDSQDRYSGV